MCLFVVHKSPTRSWIKKTAADLRVLFPCSAPVPHGAWWRCRCELWERLSGLLRLCPEAGTEHGQLPGERDQWEWSGGCLQVTVGLGCGRRHNICNHPHICFCLNQTTLWLIELPKKNTTLVFTLIKHMSARKQINLHFFGNYFRGRAEVVLEQRRWWCQDTEPSYLIFHEVAAAVMKFWGHVFVMAQTLRPQQFIQDKDLHSQALCWILSACNIPCDVVWLCDAVAMAIKGSVWLIEGPLRHLSARLLANRLIPDNQCVEDSEWCFFVFNHSHWEAFHTCALTALSDCKEEVSSIWETLRQDSRKIRFQGSLFDLCSPSSSPSISLPFAALILSLVLVVSGSSWSPI